MTADADTQQLKPGVAHWWLMGKIKSKTWGVFGGGGGCFFTFFARE